MPDVLLEFLGRIQKQKEIFDNFDWTPTEPPQTPDPISNYRLQWLDNPNPVVPAPPNLTLDQLRSELPEKIKTYVTESESKVLLLRSPAGTGKTYATVQAVQELARQGYKVLWCASRHDMFFDLQKLPCFETGLWFHWLSMGYPRPDDPNRTMCEFYDLMTKWQAKGYASTALCEGMCVIKDCAYRRQKKTPCKIIFGMHQHLIYGMAINNFDVVVIDELPLAVYFKERNIPKEGILDPAADGPVKELMTILSDLAGQKKVVSGKQLLDKIAPVLSDVYAQVELKVFKESLPVTPVVHSDVEVQQAPFYYLYDMLELLYREYKAWKAGWKEWYGRVIVGRSELKLLSKSKEWTKLPAKRIVLDATANQKLYGHLFNIKPDEIEDYAPRLERKGHLIQFTSRLNGMSDLVGTKEKPTKQASEAVQVIKEIITQKGFKNPGVISVKGIKKYLEEKLPDAQVGHFYAQRGTNLFENVDVLFVVGTPSPNAGAILQQAMILSDRLEPYSDTKNLYTTRLCTYQLASPNGKLPARNIKGYWDFDFLETIHNAYRESELLQAVYRSRFLTRECEVYLMTSTPIREPLNSISDTPTTGPEAIPWQTWVEIKDHIDRAYQKGEFVSVALLALWTGGSPLYIRRQKWIQAIYAYQRERWLWEDDPDYKGERGPRVQRIRAVEKP